MASTYIQLPPDGGGSGTITGGANVGAGAGVFKDVSGTNLRFKSLTSSDSSITIDGSDPNVIDLTTAGGGGAVTSVNTLTGAVVLQAGDGTIGATASDCLLWSNASSEVDALTVWGINSHLGFQLNQTVNPDDLNGETFNNFYLNFVPLQNSPDENWNANNYYYDIDSTSTGFSFGTSGTAITHHGVTFNAQGTGNLGYCTFLSNNFSIGNGTDPFEWRGMGYSFGFGQINNNITLVGPMQGYGFQWNMAASAVCSPTNTYATGFYDNCNVACPWEASWTSFQAGPNLAEITNNHNYTGFNISPNIDLLSGNASFYGIAISPTVDAYTGTASINGLNINPQTSVVHSAQGIFVSLDQVTTYAGTPATLVEQDLTFTVNSVGTAGNAATLEYTTGGTAGSEVVSNVGLAFSVQIEDGVSTATQIKTALDAYPTFFTNVTTTISGSASNPQVAFGPTSFAGGTDAGTRKAAYLDGDVEITGALTFGGALSIGKLNAFYSQALVSGSGSPTTVHGLVSSLTLANNLTVTLADTIGVNTACLIEIGDNSSVSTGFLGISALALPAVAKIGAASSVDRVSGAAFALSLDATAGAGSTITTLDLCRSIVIPNGITAVTNCRGFTFDLPFGDPGTTTHGVYISPTSAHNYMAKDLVIGTSDVPSNSSVGLELIATDRAIRLSVLTTAQRNALTPLAGMVIFNSDTSALEYYDGGAWV